MKLQLFFLLCSFIFLLQHIETCADDALTEGDVRRAVVFANNFFPVCNERDPMNDKNFRWEFVNFKTKRTSEMISCRKLVLNTSIRIDGPRCFIASDDVSSYLIVSDKIIKKIPIPDHTNIMYLFSNDIISISGLANSNPKTGVFQISSKSFLSAWGLCMFLDDYLVVNVRDKYSLETDDYFNDKDAYRFSLDFRNSRTEKHPLYDEGKDVCVFPVGNDILAKISAPVEGGKRLNEDVVIELFDREMKSIATLPSGWAIRRFFQNGYMIGVRTTGKKVQWSAINTKGQIVFEKDNISQLFSPSGGFFRYVLDDGTFRMGYCDTKGNEVADGLYKDASDFYNGKAYICEEIENEDANEEEGETRFFSRYYEIDRQGKKLNSIFKGTRNLHLFRYGFGIEFNTDDSGLYDKYGNCLWSTKHDECIKKMIQFYSLYYIPF